MGWFPCRAAFDTRFWELDPGYAVLRLMAAVGLFCL